MDNMAILVQRGVIKSGGAYYRAGEVVEDLSPKDEQRAEALRYGVVVEDPDPPPDPEPTPDPDPEPDPDPDPEPNPNDETGTGDGPQGDLPTAAEVNKMTKEALIALAELHTIDISGCSNNDQRAEVIIAALGL